MPSHTLSEILKAYKVLGVGKSATTTECKKAYLDLSLKFHPDKAGPDSTARFQQIAHAYGVLCDAIDAPLPRLPKDNNHSKAAEGRKANAGCGVNYENEVLDDICRKFWTMFKPDPTKARAKKAALKIAMDKQQEEVEVGVGKETDAVGTEDIFRGVVDDVGEGETFRADEEAYMGKEGAVVRQANRDVLSLPAHVLQEQRERCCTGKLLASGNGGKVKLVLGNVGDEQVKAIEDGSGRQVVPRKQQPRQLVGSQSVKVSKNQWRKVRTWKLADGTFETEVTLIKPGRAAAEVTETADAPKGLDANSFRKEERFLNKQIRKEANKSMRDDSPRLFQIGDGRIDDRRAKYQNVIHSEIAGIERNDNHERSTEELMRPTVRDMGIRRLRA